MTSVVIERSQLKSSLGFCFVVKNIIFPLRKPVAESLSCYGKPLTAVFTGVYLIIWSIDRLIDWRLVNFVQCMAEVVAIAHRHWWGKVRSCWRITSPLARVQCTVAGCGIAACERLIVQLSRAEEENPAVWLLVVTSAHLMVSIDVSMLTRIAVFSFYMKRFLGNDCIE